MAITRPKLPMGMAAAAIMAAKKSQAPTRAPRLYRRAEYFYLKAKHSYRQKYFNKAQDYANMSIKFSEKAELIAKIREIDED